ncbi:MAG: hypothetical protein NC920_03140, partial [Candidatus Omnitrophica bacterium]|nr:hypothetical protein [Candidatus Omnitrophota bacterium]
LAGIPIRVGYARKWDFLLTHKIEDKKYLGLRHEVEYNLELVELIGATTEDYSLSLGIQDSNLFDEFKDSIAVHPYTSDPIKQWPINNFLELIKKISQLNERVVIVGGKENLKISKELFYNLSKNIKDMTGRTSLVELGLLLKKCKLLVSGDSGPVHMASAVGTPVIAIFRNDIPAKSPKRWGPWGKGHIVVEKPSLSEITVEEIFSKIKDKLGASSPNTSRNGPRLG